MSTSRTTERRRPRRARLALVAALLALGAFRPGQAAGRLEEVSHEWSFAASFTDTDGAGSSLRLDFQYQWIVPSGRHEIGALFSYEKLKLDDVPSFEDDEIESLLLGPVYAWNWTPRSDRATGFLELSAGDVGTDLRHDYRYYVRAAIGVKAFVGESAAVNLRLFRQELAAQDDLDDLVSTGLGIGVSFFSGPRPAP